MLKYLAFIAALAGYVAADSCDPHKQSDCPAVPPTKDDWYTEKIWFSKRDPGYILKHRDALGNLTNYFNNTERVIQIMYTTTNSQYKRDWAVTTLLVPKNANHKALVSLQLPYDSASIDASPSYTMNNITSLPGGAAIQPLLDQGWYVNVPDYEGNAAACAAGVFAGHATIDSIRAVYNYRDQTNADAKPTKKIDLDKNPRVALYGYSGGAFASEFAAELQVQYAPEMKIAGVALGGLTPNLTTVLHSVNKTPSSAHIVNAILGLNTQYPKDMFYHLAHLNALGKKNRLAFWGAIHMTLEQAAAAYGNQDIREYFDDKYDGFLAPQTMHVINNEGMMGYHGVPTIPMYIHKAANDEISPINETDALVDKYCNMGANIYYVRNDQGNHVDEAYHGAMGAFMWVNNILNMKKGKGFLDPEYPASGCKTVNVSINETFSLGV